MKDSSSGNLFKDDPRNVDEGLEAGVDMDKEPKITSVVSRDPWDPM